MMISVKYGFVFLSTPKCASTSIDMALRGYVDLFTNFGLKHENYRRYERHYKPMLKQYCDPDKLETICLIREPVEWLASWYRYRCRDALPMEEAATGKVALLRRLFPWLGRWLRTTGENKGNAARVANSVANMSFDEFVEGYLADTRPEWAELGSQYNFIRNAEGEIGVDRLFPYERIDLLLECLGKKIGIQVELKNLNRSPELEVALDPERKERLMAFFEKDYLFYQKALENAAGMTSAETVAM